MNKNTEEPSKYKIRILQNGPYAVSGGVPLREMCIRARGHGYEWVLKAEYPLKASYVLCRCGKTKTPPFCDGAHASHAFLGTETASRLPFRDRAEFMRGETIDILDDGRCAFARFCHRNSGDAWSLAEGSGKPGIREEAILAAAECPAGRLVALDKQGNEQEPKLEPIITVVQDSERQVSGGLYVTGGIALEGADGYEYEKRNRYVLCRCGLSRNKPFCDAMHMQGFSDEGEK